MGSLMYAMICMRLDLAYVVGTVSQFLFCSLCGSPLPCVPYIYIFCVVAEKKKKKKRKVGGKIFFFYTD